MNTRTAMLLTALAATSALAQPKAPEKPDGLIVHEWGTFTSFAGPSGELQPFNIAIGDHLPDFVQARVGSRQWSGVRDIAFEKFSVTAQQRMETPVIYFYSDKAEDLSVNVQMPGGLITEVFPPVSGATPQDTQYAVPKGGSSVSWEHVKIAPKYCCDFITLPTGDSHYFQARATGADPLSVEKDGKTFSERFLFYRGIANGDLGLKAKALGDDSFQIDRSDAGPLASVFAVEVEGQNVRFAEARGVKPGDKISLPKESESPESLGAALARSLAAAGLYDDEAQAMVNTWKSLWFGERGTRLMVIMPQATIDKELPLTVSPSPKTVKRVFVARLELLTPEKLQRVEDLLARAEKPGPDRDAVNAELAELGRFHGPATKLAREAMAHQASKPPAN